MKAALALLAAAIAVSACGASPAASDAAPANTQPPVPQPLTMAQRPKAVGGEALYIRKCAMCHGSNGMGATLLSRRVDVADLEQRRDLTADYVTLAVRQGIGNMPAIPRGEVSDEQLSQIASHLVPASGAAKP